MDITMELKVPSSNIPVLDVIRMITSMGGRTTGGYAEKEPRYGKGAKYAGGSLIQLGSLYFKLNWNEDKTKVELEQIEIGGKYILASDMPVEITGVLCGDKVLFRNKKDATEWLRTMTTAEILNLSVKTPNYHGSAIMYM